MNVFNHRERRGHGEELDVKSTSERRHLIRFASGVIKEKAARRHCRSLRLLATPWPQRSCGTCALPLALKNETALLIVAHDVRHRSATADSSCGKLVHFNLLAHSADFQVLFFNPRNGRFHSLVQPIDGSPLPQYFACLFLDLL